MNVQYFWSVLKAASSSNSNTIQIEEHLSVAEK
jgi:hypothetical protein